MSTAALMPEKSATRYCRYTSIKVDVEVLLLLRLAVAHASQDSGEHIQMQEWASDILNKAAAQHLRREPIKRKPPPPGKKRGPRAKD